MRTLFSSTGKAVLLGLSIALAALSTILPATGSVMQRSGSPFLYDDSTGHLVGIRNSDGTDTFFPLYSTQAGATATAAFTPAAPGAIGGTTPAAGSFTTLTASSTLTASGTVTMAPANRSISLSPSGTGTVVISPATAGTIDKMAIGGATPAAGSFTTLTTTGTTTLGGILTVASSVRTGTTTVGALATCGATIAGARHFVTDANTTTFLVTAAGGGANAVPVVCDGTNWVIG